MGRFLMSSSVAAALAVVLMVAALTQGQVPDCAAKLASCGEYLSTTTKPPESCCKPINDTLRTQKACLCNLYNNPSVFRSLGINLTQALSIPLRCGISNDVSSCKTSTPATPPTASLTPPGVPGGDKGGSSKMAWMGVSTILIFWASIMAY